MRSHQFDDYTDRAVMSFPARAALSVLKSTYQEAGIALALPDRAPPADEGPGHERDDRRRRILKSLLDGLAIDWDEEKGERLRHLLRTTSRRLGGITARAALSDRVAGGRRHVCGSAAR